MNKSIPRMELAGIEYLP